LVRIVATADFVLSEVVIRERRWRRIGISYCAAESAAYLKSRWTRS